MSPGSYIISIDTHVGQDFVYDLAIGLDAAKDK
jgi:hypothetical protein